MISQRREPPIRKPALLLALALLLATLTGCATYRAARLPGEIAQLPADGREQPQLFVGATARVVYPDGARSAGEITALTDSTFTIGRVGNFGVEGRTLTRAEITLVEMEDQASFGSVTKATLTGIAFLVVAVGVLFVTQSPFE
ncbi:MAG: hypothetical protein IPI48_12080 [bacterium]|nr:hypothetical protein [bacterium]